MLKSVSDFDEMLRAGVISPGSSPFVESKRPPAADQSEVESGAKVLAEARTSVAVEVVDAVRRVERARVLVVSTNFLVGQRVQRALWSECYVLVKSGGRVPSFEGAFDLIVLVEALTDLDRLLEQNLPVVVVTGYEQKAAVEARLQGRKALVVAAAEIERRMLEAVQELVGALLPLEPG